MRRITAVALATTIVVALGACSSSAGSSATPTRGGTLRVGVVGLDTFDPAQADDPTAVAVAEMLFAPLVRLDPRTHEPRPEIAARWHGDAGETHFTFSLRRGVRFSDGSEITAADVKATLDRVAMKATMSPLAPLLDKVVGYAAAHDAGTATGLSGVVARDARTVEVTLSTPLSVFPAVLAHPGLGIVKRTDMASFDPKPVGSGPFEVDGATGFTFRLSRVKRALRPALVARIHLTLFAKQAEAQAAFDARRLDIVRPDADEATAKSSRGVVHSAPYLALGFYALNLKNPKFADARFRQAIVRAIDASKLVALGYPGRGQVARGLVPAGVPGGPVDQCRNVCDYSPDAAKQLLAQAFPAGQVPSLAIDYDQSVTQAALAVRVVAQLGVVGIPATARPHPVDQYSSFLANGDPEVFKLGWVGDFASTDAFLSPLFVANAPENVAHVSSPAVDGDLATARAEGRPAARQRSYRAAASGVLATFAIAPVVQFDSRLIAAPMVRRLEIDPFGGFDSTTLWLRARAK